MDEDILPSPLPGSRMQEFRFVDLESLIDEVFSQADRTMDGKKVTQYSVWSTFKTSLRQMIKEYYSMQQLKELLKKAMEEIEEFSTQEPPPKN